jgi:hypothetical protein
MKYKKDLSLLLFFMPLLKKGSGMKKSRSGIS